MSVSAKQRPNLWVTTVQQVHRGWLTSKDVELVPVRDHGVTVPPSGRAAAAAASPEDVLSPDPFPSPRPEMIAKQVGAALRHLGGSYRPGEDEHGAISCHSHGKVAAGRRRFHVRTEVHLSPTRRARGLQDRLYFWATLLGVRGGGHCCFK